MKKCQLGVMIMLVVEAQAMAAKGRKGQFAPGQIINVEAAINLMILMKV